ncbi:hypothetical protein GCM10012280_44720 [Wenjunlia tyrosinilytica]|uniref:Uncharacterized protein n=1 Tax=Wenjunlia tyrosinilytica TaxID=1544741 RepID=A0A918E0I2_9ACTN|nr:hypothetical protein GCM10012280_44720 [Wenjunlia tyrosinilytica]
MVTAGRSPCRKGSPRCDRIGRQVAARADVLWEVALRLHDTPELAFEEAQAARLLTGHLRAGIQRGDHGLRLRSHAPVPHRGGRPACLRASGAICDEGVPPGQEKIPC